ncbi:MAG: GxxExxY protein [Desulfomonile tiedjei]|uniref:GxxExxY protein n=1 Tax=Desulfomonile tiedjei TaxID=2358 RepID=A0A9D6Z4M0_9BACT|nr:GxxExxY protein [Desulfomonile tiedjei]
MNSDQHDLLREDLTGRIIGIFFELYNELGFGFLESVYEKALILTMNEKGLQVDQQRQIPVWFRGKTVGEFRADLVVENSVVIELKACRALEPSHEAQVLNYLRATEIEVGLLLNFGPKPQFKRIVFANRRKKSFRTT